MSLKKEYNLEQDCSVCCEIKRNMIICPFCKYKSCTDCNQRFILQSINTPSCMSCKKNFPSDFFYESFPKSFINKSYKEHREQILFEREKFLLPATQREAEHARKRYAILDQIEPLRKELNNTKVKMDNLKKQIDMLTYALHRLDEELNDEKKDDMRDEKKEEKKDVYISHCPVNECRGFLDQSFICGICGVKACEKCREVISFTSSSPINDINKHVKEIIETDFTKDYHRKRTNLLKKNEEKDEKDGKEEKKHICDKNVVETVKELMKSTRSCPNCHTPIFKISGCDQMWCTQCNVAFNWKTGEIEKGIIHNPHYYEYLRLKGGDIPRNPNEVQCGGMPPDRFLRRIQGIGVPDFPTMPKERYITLIYRDILHLRAVTLQSLPSRIDNICNRDLRIDFLLNRITEDEFKNKLQRREKDRNKKLEQRDILETYCNVVQDLFNDFFHKGKVMISEEEELKKYPYDIFRFGDEWSSEKADEFINNELEIRSYAKKCYRDMNEKYGSSIKCPILQ